jgi:hypothetical protein
MAIMGIHQPVSMLESDTYTYHHLPSPTISYLQSSEIFEQSKWFETTYICLYQSLDVGQRRATASPQEAAGLRINGFGHFRCQLGSFRSERKSRLCLHPPS